jgi:hypothetical protein
LTNPSSSDGLAFLAVVALLGDEFSMPAENCIRRDNRCELTQCLAADRLPFDGQHATLIIGRQNSFLRELLEQSLDLRILELDGLLLPLIDHGTEGSEQNVPWL